MLLNKEVNAMDPEYASRRDLLQFGMAAAAASACGGCALSGARRPDVVVEQTQGMIRLSEEQSSTLLQSEGSLLVQPENVAGKILVVHRDDGSLHALGATCTHAGCDVQYDQKLGHIRCPCHGSEFGLDGQNIKGPAKKPLKAYKVAARSGRVVIDL
jgi:Rieske Fe-S protein